MGTIKLVTGLSKIVTFLKNRGCLYDTFGRPEKGTPTKKLTLMEAKENIDKVYSEVRRIVAGVKGRFNLSRETNGALLLLALLTTHVENLHVVSHFEHETFRTLNYAQDFGTIVKDSLIRITTWAAKYFTYN